MLGGGHRGQADDRPDARHDRRDPPAQGRRDRRLRHRPSGCCATSSSKVHTPPALRRAPAGGLRPVGHHRGRAACGDEAAGYGAGARKVYIIEEPMAAAIGAGLPVHEPTGNMVVDIGGGTTEVARASRSAASSPASRSAPAATSWTTAIIAFVKKEYSLMLGERTAEEIKMAVGVGLPDRRTSRTPRSAAATWSPACRRRSCQRRGDPRGDRGAGQRASSTRSSARSTRLPARAGRRHHGPRHHADRRRCAAQRPRRAAQARDRHADPHRRRPADGRWRWAPGKCIEEFEQWSQVLIPEQRD